MGSARTKIRADIRDCMGQDASVKATRLISDVKFESFDSLSSTSVLWLFRTKLSITKRSETTNNLLPHITFKQHFHFFEQEDMDNSDRQFLFGLWYVQYRNCREVLDLPV